MPCINVIRQKFNPKTQKIENVLIKEPVAQPPKESGKMPEVYLCKRRDPKTGDLCDFIVNAKERLNKKRKIYTHIYRLCANPETGKQELVECHEEVPEEKLNEE